LKILAVSDGRYPEFINGVSTYLHAFLKELNNFGHETCLLHVQSSKYWGNPTIQGKNVNGIRFLEVKHSPLFKGDALENPIGSLSQWKLETLFAKVIKEERPDVIHVHELHRMPASIIGIANLIGIPVVVTLHDYWYLCPLFQLFTPEEKICPGPDFGRNCVITCLAGDPLTRAYRRCLRINQGTVIEKFLLKLRNRYKTYRKESVWQTSRQSCTGTNEQNLKLHKKIAELGKRQVHLKKNLSIASLLIAVSNACARKYIEHGVPEEHIQVIQLGLPAKKFLEPKIIKLKQLPLKIGFLGSLGPSKGAQLLMEAAECFTPQSVEFHIYGKAREEEVALINHHAGKSKNIFYHGKYAPEELENIFEQFHLLVIPSLWVETLGLIGLEAQAAGVPVLASDVGGMTDYVKEGHNGMLFQQGSVSALAACINHLLQRPDLIEKMSRNAMEPIGMQDHCRDMYHLYQGVRCR
jgi:glycosyltransferase involved in cell wall biosynthesis